MQMLIIQLKILILIAFFVLAHFIMEFLMNKLGNYKNRKNRLKFTPLVGIIDRLFYAGFYALHLYNFIIIWLGYKIALRIIITPKDEQEFNDIAERKNLYFIGNVASLILGCIGGLITIGLFGSQLLVFRTFLDILK